MTAASLPAVAAVIFAVTLLYALAEAVRSPTGFRDTLPDYLIELAFPVVAVWLLRGPLHRFPEWIAVAFDIAYTAALAHMLLQPTTTTSGSALFFSLKMLATALFFPWSARLQYLSASVTLLLYWSVIAISGRATDPAASLHQLLGPLIAALFSAAGAATADRTRERLFQRNLSLAASEAQTRTLLEAVRDSEARLRKHQAEQQVIFDSVPALIWYKDVDNRIVRVNRVAAESAGLSVEALPGALHRPPLARSARRHDLRRQYRGQRFEVSHLAAARGAATRSRGASFARQRRQGMRCRARDRAGHQPERRTVDVKREGEDLRRFTLYEIRFTTFNRGPAYRTSRRASARRRGG